MGRHSSAARWHFIRSVIIWAAPWLAAAVVVVAVGWFALSAFSGDGIRPSSTRGRAVLGDGRRGDGAAATPSDGRSRPTPRRRPSPSPQPTPPLRTRSVTVQVLDTTGGGASGSRWAHRLRSLGFDVVSVQPGLGPYAKTTVFWSSPGDRAAARALAAHFGWRCAARRPSLSPAVSVHVVLGQDEA